MNHTIKLDTLKNALTQRIAESEAELEALKKVTINTGHKKLTNKTVENARIADYMGINKALYIDYRYNHRYVSTPYVAYTYNNPDGTEIGVDGMRRKSRTMTPLELRGMLDGVIESREQSLVAMRYDLENAGTFVTEYNKLITDLNNLTEGVTWATREAIR